MQCACIEIIFECISLALALYPLPLPLPLPPPPPVYQMY